MRKSQHGNKASHCGGGLSPEADRMAGGLIRAALDRYKQPKFPPVLQSAAPCVAYIYSLGCGVHAHNGFNTAATISNIKHVRMMERICLKFTLGPSID